MSRMTKISEVMKGEHPDSERQLYGLWQANQDHLRYIAAETVPVVY